MTAAAWIGTAALLLCAGVLLYLFTRRGGGQSD
jgi:hypothetical protein